MVFCVLQLCGWSRQPPAIQQLAHCLTILPQPHPSHSTEDQASAYELGSPGQMPRGETLCQCLHRQLYSLLESQGLRGALKLDFLVELALNIPVCPHGSGRGRRRYPTPTLPLHS